MMKATEGKKVTDPHSKKEILSAIFFILLLPAESGICDQINISLALKHEGKR